MWRTRSGPRDPPCGRSVTSPPFPAPLLLLSLSPPLLSSPLLSSPLLSCALLSFNPCDPATGGGASRDFPQVQRRGRDVSPRGHADPYEGLPSSARFPLVRRGDEDWEAGQSSSKARPC
eukprot:756515-Hanusia_phi.AAC.1